MEQNSSNDNRIKFPKLVRLLCVWLVMTALCLAVTRAWVSKKESVSDNDAAFSLNPDLINEFKVNGQYLVITEDDGNVGELKSQPNNNILPGYSDDFFVGLFNGTENTVYDITEFGIEIPSIWVERDTSDDNYVAYDGKSGSYDENPIFYTAEGEKTGTYYYFGQTVKLSVTQYWIYSAKAATNASGEVVGIDLLRDSNGNYPDPIANTGTGATGQLLLPTSYESDGSTITLDASTMKDAVDNGKISRIVLVKPNSPIVLAQGKALVFQMHIEFVRQTDDDGNEMDQSMFIGFGYNKTTASENNGLCHRNIYANYEQKVD